MPNRILRDWTDSETIDSLDCLTERFFTRLIMKVDDFGRYSANPKLIKSTLFPLKTDIRETDISRWLTECEKFGLIVLYDVAQKGYLQINEFRQTLRQKNEKYPPPITCLADDTQTLSTQHADVELKRNESEKKGKEAHSLEKSNLFRKPVIPTIDQVQQSFVIHGGTKEMATKFFNKHNSVDWYLSGSPITNFNNLVSNFISNWQRNNNGNSVETNTATKIKLK